MRSIAAALIDITAPDGLEVAAIARLRVPLGIAAAATTLSALLALLAIVDIARLVVGPTAVAVVLSLALLLLPAAKLALGVPSGPMAAIVHAAPLLRAIELGDSLGRAWRAAALLSTIGPAVVAGAACAAVLIARGALPAGAGVAAAAASGALAAWIVVNRGAQMLRAGVCGRAAPWRALAQAALAAAVAITAAATAPLLESGTSAVLGPAALAVSIAIAVHLAGELLGLDARGPLRLARSLIGCGAAPWRLVGIVLLAALACAALLGAPAALMVGALSGTPLLAALGGVAVAHVIASAIAVLLARPAATDVVPRVLLLAVALVPAGLSLAAGSWIGLAVAATVALAVGGCVAARRLA